MEFLSKEEQLRIILRENPADDENMPYHTWIRTVDDIVTFAEAWDELISSSSNFTPDFTCDDAIKAIMTGKITVYSSHSIKNGTFVTPSAMEAASYAGSSGMYKAQMDIRDIAWIDEGQGMVATNNPISCSLISSLGRGIL